MILHPTDAFRTSCGATAPLELTVSGPGWPDGERRVFEHPFALIGRHERSGLRLEDGAVSRQHVYLQQFGERVFCVDLGSRTGIHWGGEPRPAGWLRPEQGVQIGPFTLELARAVRAGEGPRDKVIEDWDPLQDRASDAEFLPRITVEVGNKVLSRLCMNRTLVLVGSSPACRIRLRDSRIARYHCSLVRTPQGVWLIDLLYGSGARLNGQPLRCALVKEGDRLQVGPYLLRVWYPDARTETPPPNHVAIPAGTPVQLADATSESGQRPSEGQGSLEPAATETPVLVSALQAEMDQPREHQQDVEALRQQLANSQAECARLREQGRALEMQVAGMAGLQARLEAAEASGREQDVVRGERDRWQAEARNLQAKLTSVSAEREQLGRLSADLHAAQVERDRLQTEQQTSRHSAEQAQARVSELEQALAEAAAAHETALEAAIGNVQARLDAEQEVWRQRLEAAQQQLASEREAVCASGARLEQESAILQRVRADFAARDAEHDAALQRLQEAQDELALSRDEARGLRAGLDETLERQRDVETLGQQQTDAQAEHAQLRARVAELEGRANSADRLRTRLRDAGAEREQLRVQLRAAEAREAELGSMRAECDRLREQARALEVQVAGMAGLQARLEAAEASSREQDVVRGERDRWQAEARDLQTRLTSVSAEREQLGRLAADLHAAQVERDRLQTEQQTSRHSAEQAQARVSELEQALAEAADHETALEEARVRWESERQALEARLELGRQTHEGAVQAAIGNVQARLDAEREEWRQRLEAAQQQLVWERRLFQLQNEQNRQQTASLQTERDRLAARLAQAVWHLRAAEERSSNEAGSAVELQQLRQQAARDQVFVQLSSIRLGHMLQQATRPQNFDAPAELARPRAPLVRERAPAPEQRLTAIAQEAQVAWGETAVGQEQLPAIGSPLDRVGEQMSEVGFDPGEEKAIEHQLAPAASPVVPADEGEASASSDTPHGSAAPLGGRQPTEDIDGCLPQQTDSRSEARQGVWRQVFGFVLGK